MSVCKWCNGEMLDSATTSCHFDPIDMGNEVYLPVRYAIEPGYPSGRCHDCGIAVGGYHHPGCDMERCPKCQGQLISCGCLDEKELDANPNGPAYR